MLPKNDTVCPAYSRRNSRSRRGAIFRNIDPSLLGRALRVSSPHAEATRVLDDLALEDKQPERRIRWRLNRQRLGAAQKQRFWLPRPANLAYWESSGAPGYKH